MARNPMIAADRRQRAHRAAQATLAERARDVILPLAALALLMPLTRALFFGFLSDPSEQHAEAMEQVVLRFAIVLVGWLSLDTFSALIRADDRDVLGILPVDPGQVVVAALLRVARSRWPLVVASAVLTAPLLQAGRIDLWVASLGVLAGAWSLGLVVSAAVHLTAVAIADDPRFGSLLDLVRGNTPRAQAAFVYGPGVALLGAGWLLASAASALPVLATAPAEALVRLLAPFVASGWVAAALPRLAGATWFRASAVLAEIDVRYAALVDPEEGRRVYLDWVVRWLPPPARPFALLDLRHGWRGRRSWVTGAWLAGLAGLVAVWTVDPAGPARGVLVVAASAFACGTVGVLLEADEPELLKVWLPRPLAPWLMARAVVLFAWLQPVVWPAAVGALLRHGGVGAAQVALGGEVGVALAVGLAMSCGGLARRGLALYGPVAAVLAAALGLTLGGAL